jgi:hypothetical protein
MAERTPNARARSSMPPPAQPGGAHRHRLAAQRIVALFH